MFVTQQLDMKVAILANDAQKEEWLFKPADNNVQLIWLGTPDELLNVKADAYFNLYNSSLRAERFSQLNQPVFINSVIHPLSTVQTLPNRIIHPTLQTEVSPGKVGSVLFRVNAWPTFLKREVTEIAACNKADEKKLQFVFSGLGWKYRLVPDIPGMITARVIAMVINEAYFTLEAGVSSKKEIDTAMKLGTNYPFGPFEWSEKIGLKNIFELLKELSKSDDRYDPCQLLIQEAEQE